MSAPGTTGPRMYRLAFFIFSHNLCICIVINECTFYIGFHCNVRNNMTLLSAYVLYIHLCMYVQYVNITMLSYIKEKCSDNIHSSIRPSMEGYNLDNVSRWANT